MTWTKTSRWFLSVLIASLSLSFGSFASDDNWGDGWENDWDEQKASPWQWHGFLEAGYGARLQNNDAIKEHTTLKEFRGRLELDYTTEHWRVDARADALYDGVLAKSQWQTRELALSFSPADSVDIKAGRQVLTWGTGDYLFLNDLFPKDWPSFFSGREDEYLKAPSDSIKASWFANQFSLDLVWTPEFTADNSLNGERFSFFSPATGLNTAPDPALNPEKPGGNTWSTRLATTVKGIEYALYGYTGYWTTPLGTDSSGRLTYPRLDSWGGSLRTPLGKGLFNSEIAWYDSREDSTGTNPDIPNSQLRWLAAYEQEIASNLTAAVQYYLEWTLDYDELKYYSSTPEYDPEEYRQLLTLRLTWLTLQQKLAWSMFTFWSFTDQDTYLKPMVSYRADDSWQLAAGANLFFGSDRHTFFGQHEDNSNAWVRVRYNY